jgi:L-seryl-tRNA(Ser) seleniumtransferase
VDAVLAIAEVRALTERYPRSLVVRAAREEIEAARQRMLAEHSAAADGNGWALAVARRVASLATPSLVPVINAAGVILHTNLGRAPLARAAIEAMNRVASGYSALEYDLAQGTRGQRHTHCRDLLVELTGAEDAFVVNNAAGALLLALSTHARDGEVVVSRGELIEIGGSFRIPDILARSGARLMEVGTTNRTHESDYQKAVTPGTRILLKVHRSNFRVSGFTADVPPERLALLAHERGLLSLYDLGSGLMLDLSRWTLTGEPTAREAVASGADLVVMSGDKLLGGPQAGIIIGRSAAVRACREDPTARAVRADKLTLAALEATLALYRDAETARREIPVLRMLTEDQADVRRRAESLRDAITPPERADVVSSFAEVGGGAFPGAELPTWVVALSDRRRAAVDMARLRANDPPVIARIEHERVVLDARTIAPDEIATVARAVTALGD